MPRGNVPHRQVAGQQRLRKAVVDCGVSRFPLLLGQVSAAHYRFSFSKIQVLAHGFPCLFFFHSPPIPPGDASQA